MNNNYKNYFESPLFMFFKKSLMEFHYIKLSLKKRGEELNFTYIKMPSEASFYLNIKSNFLLQLYLLVLGIVVGAEILEEKSVFLLRCD